MLQTGTPATTQSGVDRNFLLPNNQQWNLTVERALGRNTVASLAYLGNKGTHLFRGLNYNASVIDPTTGKLVRAEPNFGTANTVVQTSDANSIYNAMQMEVRRRPSSGMSYQINWTWAKGLDDTGPYANTNILDIQDRARDRANSDYVRRHQVNSNFTWELPIGRRKKFGSGLPMWADAALGGWRLSGISRFTTGRYLTPTYSNTTGFTASNRPDVVYGVSPDLPRDQRRQGHWFNPKAFAVPPVLDPVTGILRFGNAGRNIVAGPQTNMFDGSLTKSFRVFGERRLLTLRMDMFNAFNHPNWANPDVNISNVNTVGVISAINGTMRQTQFSAQFQF